MEIKVYSLYLKNNGNDEKIARDLYDILIENIRKEKLILDFEKMDLLTTAFFNDCIGKLFLCEDEKLIRENLVIRNIQEDDMELLVYSIDTALKKKNIQNI